MSCGRVALYRHQVVHSVFIILYCLICPQFMLDVCTLGYGIHRIHIAALKLCKIYDVFSIITIHYYYYMVFTRKFQGV